jgi:hypothetical protein
MVQWMILGGVILSAILFFTWADTARRFWVLCAVPAIWFLLFYGFVLRSYLALGQWPRPYLPDPKELGFVWHHALISISFPLMFVLPLVFAVLVTHDQAKSWRGWGVAFFVVSFAAWFLVVRLDPGQFIYWFMD